MSSLPPFLTLGHLIGLAIGVGAATVKLRLLFKCRADQSFVPVFIKVARPITGQIVLGLALLTLSGIGWMFVGHTFTWQLVVKIALVLSIWVLGPVIDNVVEPKYVRLAPAAGGQMSPEFVRVQSQYLMLEVVATGLFYAIILLWLLA